LIDISYLEIEPVKHPSCDFGGKVLKQQQCHQLFLVSFINCVGPTCTSGDMGWQGRSSSNSYNSLSGDALLVGQHARKPVAWYILGKACSFCQGWMRSYRGKHGEPIPQHDCRKNWDGSSGAIEPIAILEMTKLLC